MAEKLEEIIDSLCSHKISKGQALEEIINIFDEFKSGRGHNFVVDGVGFSAESNHGYISAVIRYGYKHIENKIKKGDTIYVTVIPY